MESVYDRYTSTQALAVTPDLDYSVSYFRAHIERFLPHDVTARILDLGCGYGKNIYALKTLGYQNTFGVDISMEQVDYARNKLKLSNVTCDDALSFLSLRRNEFDAILIADVLEHLPLDDLLEMGKLIKSALKPDGCVIVQVPNGLAPMSPYIYGDLTHFRAFTVPSLQQFFLMSGLHPVGYYELPEHLHGWNSFVRKLLWKILLRPAISVFFRIAYGPFQNIFTANILAVARLNDPL